MHLVLVVVAVASIISGCGSGDAHTSVTEPAAAEPVQASLFTLLPAAETGISFTNTLTENVHTNENVLSFQYFFNGGGVAVGDINNDGLQDVLFTGNQVSNRLYLNKGNFQFEDITKQAGLTKKNWSSGATMADVNNDGHQDIYICQAGPSNDPEARKNLLYINKGDGSFTEQAETYGVADGNRSTQASFFDYDQDGDLDLYVMNEAPYFYVPLKYVFEQLKDKANLEASCGKLFRNNGNGSFTNVTEQAGMLKYGYGLGLVTADINHDGWVDVYVANDYSVPDYMYINNGDGTFTDRQKDCTKQIAWFGMGADVADINNDGWSDLAVVDMAANDHIRSKTLMQPMNSQNFRTYVEYLGYQYQFMYNALQLSTGRLPGTTDRVAFSNIANMAGVANTDWSWAALFADFDNDGHKDYFVSNGYRRYALDNDFRNMVQQTRQQYNGKLPPDVREQLYQQIPSVKLPNLLYHSNGELGFENKSAALGVGQPSYSNGAAYADLDNDGDLDLLVSNIEDAAFVYRNNATEQGNNYLQLTFETGARTAENLNATATIFYGADEQQQFLENTPVRGYQSAVGEQLHFGLGNMEQVDRVIVSWPDNHTLVIRNPAINSAISVNKANASPTRDAEEEIAWPLISATASKSGLTPVHHENEFDDFEREVLLPHKQSALGPFLAVGDVTGDGREDVFVGGAAGSSGTLMLQGEDRFKIAPSQPWKADAACEDLGATLFDADGDGDLDLYVVSGGNELPEGHKAYQDRLYLNNGSGNFSKAGNALPAMQVSGLAVSAHDVDGDGDNDLLIGGRAIPGRYPHAPRTFLLQNDGAGTFTDVTATNAPDLLNPGLINAIEWLDLDGDNDDDLVLAGEWMPVSFYRNDGGKFSNITSELGMENTNGWWYSLAVADVDGDGDSDLIAGNIGTNTKFHPSQEKPLHLFSDDLDANGTCDVVLGKDYKGALVPTRGRQCSSEQMPFVAQKFPSYRAFAEASIQDIYTPEKLNSALHHEAREFRSMVFVREGDSFTASPLPAQAQMAPINGIVVADFSKNGHPDLLIAGNMFGAEIETPRYDAGMGLLLENSGHGDFVPVPAAQSGFYVPGDVKDLQFVNNPKGLPWVIATNNNGPLNGFNCHARPTGRQN